MSKTTQIHENELNIDSVYKLGSSADNYSLRTVNYL